MPPLIAILIFVVGIVGLFAVDREKGTHVSKAVWIPVGWLFINSSRPVSLWLGVFGLGNGLSDIDQKQVYLEGSPIDRAVYVFLLIAGLIILGGRSQQIKPLLRRMGPILFFFLYCAISVVWSDYPFVAFKHWTKGIGDLVMVLVILTDPVPSAALRRLFSRVGFVLIPLSILFIKYVPNLGRIYTIGGASEYTGVTTQKNTLGVMCLVFGFGALWRLLAVYRDRTIEHRSRLLLVHGIVVAMVVWLLRTCDSMTSFSCFLMGATIMILANRPGFGRKPVVIHLLVGAMVGVSLFAVFFQSGGGLLENMGRDATLTGRTAIWNAVLRLAGNPLVGTGYESFWLGDRLQRLWSLDNGRIIGINEAHNGYLELFLNLGWIGAALLAVVIVAGYRNVISTFLEDPDAGSLGVAFFVAEVAYNFTEAGFRMLCPLWVFFLLAIVGIPKTVQQGFSKSEADSPRNFSVSRLRRDEPLHVRFRNEVG